MPRLAAHLLLSGYWIIHGCCKVAACSNVAAEERQHQSQEDVRCLGIPKPWSRMDATFRWLLRRPPDGNIDDTTSVNRQYEIFTKERVFFNAPLRYDASLWDCEAPYLAPFGAPAPFCRTKFHSKTRVNYGLFHPARKCQSCRHLGMNDVSRCPKSSSRGMGL